MEAELQDRCVFQVSNDAPTIRVNVTLSENWKNLIWTAEINQAGISKSVALLAVPFSLTTPKSVDAFPVRIASEKFWEGGERVLDAAEAVTANGDQLMILLLPDVLVVRNASRNTESRINVPLAIPTSELRDPKGTVSQNGNLMEAWHGRFDCTISLTGLSLFRCQEQVSDAVAPSNQPFKYKGGQFALTSTNCSKGSDWLVTGTGDDTQPDTIQIVEWRDPAPAVISNQLDFPGPVISIHIATNKTSGRVIVRNLQTGNYEAYRLSISCAL
jgi:hypothetical protein